MVSIDIVGFDLKVTISGWDAVWALRRSLTVPLAHVVGASIVPVSNTPTWRIFGTGIPGGLKAGWFRTKGENEFWLVHRRTTALEIRLRDEKYARLVLQVENPEEKRDIINRETGGGVRAAA